MHKHSLAQLKRFKEDLAHFNKLEGEIDHEALSESHRWGFRDKWQVLEQYSLKNGFIEGEGGVKKLYTPASFPEVADDFQKLGLNLLKLEKHNSAFEQEAVMSFVQRWGALGWVQLRPELEKDIPAGEHFLAQTVKEPVDWIAFHALATSLVLTTVQMIQEEKDEGEIERMVRRDLAFPARGWIHECNEFCVFPGNNRQQLFWLAAHMIDLNVSGIHLSVQADTRAVRVESQLRFTALIEVIWWHVMRILGGGVLKQCPECQAIFLARRSNQVYCPAPSWYGAGAESLCAARHRMREHRKEQRGKQEI